MYSDRPRYREIQQDADAFSDLDYTEPLPRRRSKSFSVILAVACVIALGLAASFYHAARPPVLPGFKSSSPKNIRKILKKSDIIPNVIDDFSPSLALSVSWSSTSFHAKLGNTLKPKNLQSAPQVQLSTLKHGGSDSAPPEDNVVLAMTDPDAPSHKDPKWAEFCHWIASGVQLVDSTSSYATIAKSKNLKTLVEYRPPGPPAKTGKHRYVFLAFAPVNATSDPLHLEKPDERKGWGVNGWAEQMGLAPIAANFIYAQNEN